MSTTVNDDSKIASIVEVDFPYENLALEGGGIRGIAHLGVLKYLEERGLRKYIRRLIGTSAGSIIALLWNLGYTYPECHQLIGQINFKQLRDDSVGIFRDTHRLMTQYGILPGNKVRELLGQYMEQKGFSTNTTFQQMYDRTGLELTAVATDVTSGCPAYLNYHNTPHMKVLDAVRMSISYPFVFTAVHHDNHIYIDGGMYDNFPITYWDKNGERFNHKTLGVLLSTQEQIDRQEYQTDTIWNYISSVWNQVTNHHQNIVLTNERECQPPRVIEINTGDIKTFEFDITEEKIALLISRGYKASRYFFEKVSPLNSRVNTPTQSPSVANQSGLKAKFKAAWARVKSWF